MITVRVSRADIRQGKRCDPGLCPVALALARVLITAKVSEDAIVIDWRSEHPRSIPTPGHVRDFIHRYDWRLKVKPFVFEVPEPQEVM